jgi:RNA polymerase sigma-70 factor (ECF subfamily)
MIPGKNTIFAFGRYTFYFSYANCWSIESEYHQAQGMNNYATFTDRELTDRLNDRDNRAYTEIYNRYWKLMLEFAYKMSHNEAIAKDITQDSFLRLYDIMGNTDFRKIDIAPYLHQILKNTFVSFIRRAKLNAVYMASLKDFVEAGDFITDQRIIESETRKLIEEAIATLPKRMRAVFEMSRKGYLTHKQIAEVTNLSEHTVKSQIARALKIIRSRLSAFLFLQFMYAIILINKIF